MNVVARRFVSNKLLIVWSINQWNGRFRTTPSIRQNVHHKTVEHRTMTTNNAVYSSQCQFSLSVATLTWHIIIVKTTVFFLICTLATLDVPTHFSLSIQQPNETQVADFIIQFSRSEAISLELWFIQYQRTYIIYQRRSQTSAATRSSIKSNWIRLERVRQSRNLVVSPYCGFLVHAIVRGEHFAPKRFAVRFSPTFAILCAV